MSAEPSTIASEISTLRASLNGRVIRPDDPRYDEARVPFFSAFARRPAVIVRPRDAADVARVVALARDTGAELAVRSGGHSSAGHSVTDGGILLDLADMKDLQIDVAQRTAWAQTGLTAGEYTTAAGEHGLATGFGDTASVGIGGITLGGGVGYLTRRYGLTIDDVLAAEVVTADGQILHTDAETHPDLYWAIRGGGGNFGVVTRLQFRLHEVNQVVGGMLLLPATPKTIANFAAEAMSAPEDLSLMAGVMKAPPLPFIPPEHHGVPVIVAVMVHVGAPDDGERVVDRFRALATPLADMVKVIRYPEIYEAGGPQPPAMAVRSFFLDEVDEDAGATILERLQTSTAVMATAQFRFLGGAVARVPADATAFAHRDRGVMVNVASIYEDPAAAAEQEAWVTSFADELRGDDRGAYVNFMGNEGQDRIREAYTDATWQRLRSIKRRYDPTNLFRLNQNIPPADD